MELERQEGHPNGLTPEKQTREFFNALVRIADNAPWELTIPRDLTLAQFGKAMRAARTVARKSAFWWGQLYKTAVEVYGERAYQLLDGWDYQESTLQRYRRLTTQIDPTLWPEPIADRHFFVIGGLVEDPAEQRRWVEHTKTTGLSSDQLREDIKRDQEERGLRPRAEHTTWVQCHTCNGDGGWPEIREPSL
ncbi:MAG TPA: hypothetical protein VEY30_02010 [Myxococcaceae bacterium]|nr:hypothetical protein [Myxococcaceae bacterium]